MLQEILTDLQSLFSINITEIFRAGFVFVLGLILASTLSRLVYRLVKNHWSTHQAYISRQAVYWFIFVLFIIMTLRQLGFDLCELALMPGRKGNSGKS